jgi:hypothetical protein
MSIVLLKCWIRCVFFLFFHIFKLFLFYVLAAWRNDSVHSVRCWWMCIFELLKHLKNAWSSKCLIQMEYTVFRSCERTHHICSPPVRGGADKSLARPEMKQATANKLGIYSAYSPRSSTHFLAHCCNFCKPPKKKIIRLSVLRALRGSNDLPVGRKTANFQLFFLVQGTTGPDPENRMGDKDTESPSRTVSFGLQVPGEPGHCRARTRHPMWPSRGVFLSKYP